jgi:3-hydroxybutyryl-CoA dehydrogenase
VTGRAIATAAVVGSGTMGTGFAQLLALAGIDVRVADARPDLGVAARDRAIALADRFESLELMPAGSAGAIAQRTVAAASIAEAVAGADVVFEAVTEDVEVKRSVLAQVEDAASDDAIVATNTSAIPIRVLSAQLRRPDRFLGTHWFNPPQWVPAVEVIPGAQTQAGVVADAMDLLQRIGKEPALVGDGPGFVANRIQFAMFREAALLVEEGVATAADVDAIVRSSFGFRLPFYGPFAIADMAGLDVYAGAYGVLRDELGERFSPPASLTDLVSRQRLGTKSGGGYLMAQTTGSREVEDERDGLYAALERLRGRE